MQGSVEQFLNQVARRGSWIGGGSVAALSAALSAALLEKLVHQPAAVRRLYRIRRDCLSLVQQDADTFARVIRATRTKDRQAFRRSLKTAIEVPCRVFAHAQALHAACRRATRSINARFHSDLQCAGALADAAGAASCAFIETNLAWLGDRMYTRSIRGRLRSMRRTHAR
ncbi:MAG: cyclodeaminase/cyclohydrolase family protein [Candidatus Omnitrophica bacterium]|nr:cyclodeaminase/cyclohydrolase family protein [Candidatus Omnitrophota bacterium]